LERKSQHPEPHPQKNGEGWLLNEQEQLVVCFRNALASAHAQWVEIETRPLRGGGRPVVRRMLRHNAIEAWQTMLKSGWVRCSPAGADLQDQLLH